jgi:hypothetical protein
MQPEEKKACTIRETKLEIMTDCSFETLRGEEYWAGRVRKGQEAFVEEATLEF